MIKVLFFAQIRELLECDSLSLNAEYADVEALRSALALRSDKWALALNKEKLLVAVNQEITELSTRINDGDEVAFFPPVTGG